MYQKYQESQNIKRSMIVLSLSLILVYIVLYYAKWDLWKQNINSSTIITWDVIISEVNNDTWSDTKNDWLIFEEPTELHGDVQFDMETDIIDTEVVVDVPNNNKDNSNQDSEENIWWDDWFILSWTKSYYGELDFVERLWISYEYALKDEKNIYYLNMWDYDYDFSDIARKLKWSLYVMNTEQELIANGLFWEKVTYINIPEYKDQKVLILLEIDNGSWLLAIDYSVYHQVKPYLKTLFID